MDDFYRSKADVAEAKAKEAAAALDKALAKLADAAASSKTELDPTEHTRIVAQAETAQAQARGVIEVARIKHHTIRFVAVLLLIGWMIGVVW